MVNGDDDGNAYEVDDEDDDDVEDEITDVSIHCMGWSGYDEYTARTIKIEAEFMLEQR